MLVVAVFMTSMIAPIMAPVAIVMGCIIMPAQLSVARVRSMDATLAPVLIIMPVKMPVGGDPIAMFFRLMLSVVVALFPMMFAMSLFINLFMNLVLTAIAEASRGSIPIAIGQCGSREGQ